MTIQDKLTEKTLMMIRTEKIITIEQLNQILGCSVRTIQRYLNKWKMVTSYNQNGRYYTLPEIPKFNEYGLWQYKNVYFSKYGNLKTTTLQIINQAHQGLSAAELSEILKLPAQTFLSHFKKEHKLRREKYNGIYIYFSIDKEYIKKQMENRNKQLQVDAKTHLPNDTDSIIILVELIKFPKDNFADLTNRVRRKGLKISIQQVRNLLIYHKLEKKIMNLE